MTWDISKYICLFSVFTILFVMTLVHLIPDAVAQDSEIDVNKTEAFLDDEKYEELLSYLGDILRKNHQDEVALNYKGLALYYLDRDLEAIEYFDKALKFNPENAEALYNKAKTLHILERYDDALVSIDKALEINPEYVSALNRKGLILFDLSEYEEAITNYDKVLEIDPERLSALDRKGHALIELGKIEEAIQVYDKAIKIDPDYVEALTDKGNAFYDLERYEEAIEYFDRALEIDPKFNKAHYNRGDALKSLGRYELGSTIFPTEINKDVIHETFWPIITGNPLVCAVEFENESLPSGYVDRALKETGIAISEWEVHLKNTERYLKDQHIWEIDFTVVSLDERKDYDYSKCDVTIKFLDIPEDPDLQLFVYGIAMPNKLNKEQTNIEIYLTKISTCRIWLEKVGNIQYYSDDPCYSDKVRATDVIATTIRHEFGHALGLGHYYSEDPQRTNNWSNGLSPAPSLMVRFSLDNEKLQKILPSDIEMVRSIYGENGFLANLKVPQVETSSSALGKIQAEEVEIPDWIRNNAKWWVEGTIGDSDFTSGVQYLVKEGIIKIPDTVSSGDGSVQEIPAWIKNNADWWAKGLISDDDFVKGIQYLIEQGIIQV